MINGHELPAGSRLAQLQQGNWIPEQSHAKSEPGRRAVGCLVLVALAGIAVSGWVLAVLVAVTR